MGAQTVEKMFNNNVPSTLYEEVESKLKIYEELVPYAVLKENKELQNVVNKLTAERDSLSGQVKEVDKRIKEVKDLCDKRIAESERSYNLQVASIKRNTSIELEDAKKKARNNADYSIKQSLVKPLEAERDGLNKVIATQEEQLKKLNIIIESQDSNTKAILDKLDSLTSLILSLGSDSSVTKEELVEEVKEQLVEDANCIDYRILELMSSGTLTDKDIASIIWPDKKNGAVNLCNRKKTKRFQDNIKKYEEGQVYDEQRRVWEYKNINN